MDNLLLTTTSKDTPMFTYFCTAISDAIAPTSGLLAVQAHLRSLGLTDARILRVRRKYWRTHAQYVVLSPKVLKRDVTDVYEFFVDIIDPSTSRNFFNSDHAKQFRTEMTYSEGLPLRYSWCADVHGDRELQEWSDSLHLHSEFLCL